MDPRIHSYLETVLKEASRICGDHLLSVLLFGSAARGEFSPNISDVDLIFIISDNTTSGTTGSLEHRLSQIEASLGPSRDYGHFLHVFASRTALFKSHFIINNSTLRSLHARKLFKEVRGFSLPLGSFLFRLAPSELVLRNVLAGALTVYGEDFLGTLNLPVSDSLSNVKSFVVSLSLSIFGSLASLLVAEGTMFSLESLKWFLLDIRSSHSTRSQSLADALSTVQHLRGRFVLAQFSSLRQHYKRSIPFSLSCPLYLVYLFVLAGRCSFHQRS